jgi:succinyl-diaminopimelate desuccinylase
MSGMERKDDDPLMEQVFDTIDAMRRALVMSLIDVCSIPAVSPASGGEGELAKTEWLSEHIKTFGFDRVERYDAVDDHGVVRPNLIAVRHGVDPDAPTLWFVSHTDVVPEGDLSLWDTDPWKPVIVGDKVVGRGVEDNGTPLVASLYAVRALEEMGIRTGYHIGCAMLADEENGSRWGIQHVLEKDLFKPEDIIMVPDAGLPKGDFIEIAEKSILWLKFKTEGLQGHASMPHMYKNAFEAGAELAYRLNKTLKETYTATDELFDPPYSTFELTMKLANVANINTIPGEDIFYIDSRVLPGYDTQDVLGTVRGVMKQVGERYGVPITLSLHQHERAAPITDKDSRVVTLLSDAIRQVLDVEPKVYGIGGGTCAAFFRRRGFNAAVWAKIDEAAHSAGEYTWIENVVEMTKVFAYMALKA